MSDTAAGGEYNDSDAQQENAALLLWSLGAWHRQQQRYREWLANHRRNQQHLRAISKVRGLHLQQVCVQVSTQPPTLTEMGYA